MITGICTTHDNPDLWYPEVPMGRPTESKNRMLALQVSEAVSLCNQCPSQSSCLEFGMKPEDLSHGIWGGKIAGQRVIDSGINVEELNIQSDEYKAVEFYKRLEPYL